MLEEEYGDRILLQKKCFFRSKKYAQTVRQEVPGQPYRGVPVVSWHRGESFNAETFLAKIP